MNIFEKIAAVVITLIGGGVVIAFLVYLIYPTKENDKFYDNK